jgi:hypothetical protein
MLYKFVFAKKSYYDLVITRHVEPQVRTDEEKQKQQASALAQGEAVFVFQGRKKQHWQVSPYIRVRVKHRIKRWDGYWCVLRI